MSQESEDIRRYSADELDEMRDQGQVVPTRPDAPAHPLDEAFWANARVVMPSQTKAHVNMRIDRDVLDWFRAQGKGHLTRMNTVLRSYVDTQKKLNPR